MASRAPPFGSWEAGRIETARKVKPGASTTNPNELDQTKPKPPEFGAWEGGDQVPYTEFFEKNIKTDSSKPHMNRDIGPTLQPKTPQTVNTGIKSGDPHAKTQGVKLVGESTVKKSPLHPGMAVRSSDSKPSSFDSSKGRSGKPKHRPSPHGGPNPTRGPTVPEFGNWAQSDQFTDVFKEIQREKEGIPRSVDVGSSTPRSTTKQPKKCGCCSWLFR